ncbi:MAG: hypothetical protein QG641_296 [Candidatus Poribacteria bacterium]|nr:hypothetical protein [Euryarchaeota archaeon]MDQ1327016.1 hypothetical protein [Candidatus Poribacteria bacterium]
MNNRDGFRPISKSKTGNWESKIVQYCEKYNIPLFYLSDILDEPKVIPMIRGKAFEFTVFDKLLSVLDKNVWQVKKPNMNAQLGFHDIDIQVAHIKTGKTFSIECKLASKGSCKVINDKAKIQVKCMRSRTLGEGMVKNLSPKLKIPEGVLQIHNDQYLESDFEFVITSIGNAFYQTDNKGAFVFSPDKEQAKFLKNFPGKNLQEETFNCLFIASSKKISIRQKNGVICTRQKCNDKGNCAFIPNYPIIQFNTSSLTPLNNWHHIEEASTLFTRELQL